MPKIASCAIIFAVVAIHFLYILHYSVNFPFLDDFLFIQFIYTISQKGVTLADSIQELFKTFNDHKAVVPRLLAWVDYTLTGHLHFKFYILVASLNLTVIFWFFYHQFKKLHLPLYYFVPVPFLFFQPIYHEVSDWALTGLQHTFLTVFLVAAITLVQRGTNVAFYSALVCCLLATYTHGNGILSFPALVFYFLCVKNFKKAAIVAGFMALALVVYLLGYERGQAAQMPPGVGAILLSLLCFMGSAMTLWQDPTWWSAAWGSVVLVILLALCMNILKKYRTSGPERPFTAGLLSLLVFILATGVIVAIVRSWAGVAAASRFQLYGTMVLLSTYLFALDRLSWFRQRAVIGTVTVLSVFYWGYSYYCHTSQVAIKKATYESDIYNWVTNRRMLSVERSFVRNASFYLVPSYQSGIFDVPQPLVSQAQLRTYFCGAAPMRVNLDMYMSAWDVARPNAGRTEHLTFHFLSSDRLPAYHGLLTERFLVLQKKDSKEVFMVPANPKVEARKIIATTGRYYKNGFNALLRSDDLDTGSYDLGLLDVGRNGKRNFYRLNKSLSVDHGKLVLL